MDAFTIFALCLGTVLGLSIIATANVRRHHTSIAHQKLLRQFLLVYLICTAADWLQGPYVYALYASYRYTKAENALLFVVGFTSAGLFGIFAGSFADHFGRRTACILYCVLYFLSCMTKHFNIYEMLLLGRVLGGAATSLLFSAFEAWMVSEHEKRGFDMACVSATFSHMVFTNSVVAVCCGFVSEFASRLIKLTPIAPLAFPALHLNIGGYLSPFDLSALCCVAGAQLMLVMWTNNYGSAMHGVCANIGYAVKTVATDARIGVLGIVCALYEASLYIFIFQWTPALTPSGSQPPYGLIFATFMLGCMLGAQLYLRFSDKFPPQSIALGAMILAALSHAILLVQSCVYTNLVAFLVFEVSVGLYFPSIGTMKAMLVPEAHRATIYNIFRIPLNMVVCLVLVFDTTILTAFIITTTNLVFCVIFMSWLSHVLSNEGFGLSIVKGNSIREEIHTDSEC